MWNAPLLRHDTLAFFPNFGLTRPCWFFRSSLLIQILSRIQANTKSLRNLCQSWMRYNNFSNKRFILLMETTYFRWPITSIYFRVRLYQSLKLSENAKSSSTKQKVTIPNARTLFWIFVFLFILGFLPCQFSCLILYLTARFSKRGSWRWWHGRNDSSWDWNLELPAKRSWE